MHCPPPSGEMPMDISDEEHIMALIRCKPNYGGYTSNQIAIDLGLGYREVFDFLVGMARKKQLTKVGNYFWY